MAVYDFNAQTGVITPDTEEVLQGVRDEWRSVLGQDLVVTPDTPQGVLMTAEAVAREAVAANNAALANQINPNLAGGVFLDAICNLMGLQRRSESSSVAAEVLLAGLPGTVIPAGALARSDDGNLWALTAIAVLGDDGTAVGQFRCTVAGPVACLAGQLNQVVDMVLGWETAISIADALVGAFQESDVALARRRLVTLARQTISTPEAQISGVNDVDGVTSSVFRENVTNTTQVIDGITLVAHSIWMCVDGGPDAEVARVMLKNKTAGANFNGDTAVVVTDPASGQTYNVLFDRPEYIYPTVRITVRKTLATSNPAREIPLAVEKWAAGQLAGDPGLQIGAEVSRYEIAGAINITNPAYFIVLVDLAVGGTGYPDSIPITLRQRAIIKQSQVIVTVI